MKSGKKAVYTAELLALGGLADMVCTSALQFCDWNDNGVMATSGRVDCWTGKVTTAAR